MPERYGAGENGKSQPLLQRVFESLAAQMGSAYDQTVTTAFGIETLAESRAITFDGYGSSQRLANEFFAPTDVGLLKRWERIFNVPPAQGDFEPTRRARVAAAWKRIGQPNSVQPVTDGTTAAAGPLFVGLVHQNATNALTYVNGLTAVSSAGTTPPTVTLTGTPTQWALLRVEITSNGALGVAQFRVSYNGGLTFPITGATTAATYALPYLGVVLNFSAGPYTNDNVYTANVAPADLVPWYSTIRLVNVELQIPAGYANPDGSPNAAWYAQAGAIGPYLDGVLQADEEFQWFVDSFASPGNTGFYLDDPANLDLEIFDV